MGLCPCWANPHTPIWTRDTAGICRLWKESVLPGYPRTADSFYHIGHIQMAPDELREYLPDETFDVAYTAR